jgi:hypothetical protein
MIRLLHPEMFGGHQTVGDLKNIKMFWETTLNTSLVRIGLKMDRSMAGCDDQFLNRCILTAASGC